MLPRIGMEMFKPFSSKLLFMMHLPPFKTFKLSHPHHPPHLDNKWKSQISSHDRSICCQGISKRNCLLAHKEVLGLDSARTNVVRLGVQLTSVWVHMVPLVLCKNLTFCCFSCICFCIRFWRQRCQMSPIPPVVVSHLLAAGYWLHRSACSSFKVLSRRGFYLIVIRRIFLLSPVPFLFGSDDTMASFVSARLADGSRVWHCMHHNVQWAAEGMLSGVVLCCMGWGWACTGAKGGPEHAMSSSYSGQGAN